MDAPTNFPAFQPQMPPPAPQPTTAPTTAETPTPEKKPRKKRGGRRTPLAADREQAPALPVQQPRRQPRPPRRANPAKRPRTNPARRAKRPSRGAAPDLPLLMHLISIGVKSEDHKPLADIVAILQELPITARDRIMAAALRLFA